jgi:hypothetical protein
VFEEGGPVQRTPDTTRYFVAVVLILMLVSIVNVADKELLAPVADAVKAELKMTDTQPEQCARLSSRGLWAIPVGTAFGSVGAQLSSPWHRHLGTSRG